jgi:hypothetical protein
MDLSLSRSTSLSEEEQLPVENVEFSLTLNNHDDPEEQVSKPRPVTAAVVKKGNRKHHVRQQSGGSSIGSVDSLEADETTVPIMSAAQQQQLYWQQWQQYYATYGYPHYSATATEGYSPAQQQQQQPPHQVDYQRPYDVMEHHRRASDPMGGSTLLAYGSNMYPLSNQPHQQSQPPHQQHRQRQQGLLNQQQQSQQQYSPSWPMNHAQGTPPSTPAQSNFPVLYERSSSNPGISYAGGAGGGAATAKNNSNHRTVGISLRTDAQHDEASPLQLSITPKSGNYGTALSGGSSNNNNNNNNSNNSRSPKMVHHHDRSQSLGRGSIDAAGRHHQRSNSDVQTSRIGGGGNNAMPASRSGLALSLPRPAHPMRLSSSKKRLDNTPPPSSRPSSVGGGGSGRHRRNSSLASSGGLSVSSMVSVVSDIRKSGTYT